MKAFIAIAMLVALGSAKSVVKRSPQVNCNDPFKNIQNVCKQPNTQVYFAHPTDSTKFLQCDVFGRMYIIQCPQGEHYNVATTSCAMPPTTPAVTTSQPIVVTTKDPNNPCTPIALAQGNIYFAYAKDVTKFIECDMNGNVKILSCPIGLIWKKDKKACVYVHTGGAIVTTQGPHHQPITSNITNPCTKTHVAANELYFSAPNPHQFIQCDYWGDSFLVNCPSGMIWNEYYKTCASPFIQGSKPIGK